MTTMDTELFITSNARPLGAMTLAENPAYYRDPPTLYRYLDLVSGFGIDIDVKSWDMYESTIRACERYGGVKDYPTEHGWHFKVFLPKPVMLWEAFWMRYKCGDDYHRLVRDMLKALVGAKTIDVLFDLKNVKRKSIFEE